MLQPYETRVLADSIADNIRLTTLLVNMPRFILAEFNTHRLFSRNGASSRARPVDKRADNILAHGFVPDPDILKSNKRGMQGGEQLSEAESAEALAIWRDALEYNCAAAKRLAKLVHKEWAGRLLDAFDWQPTIVSSTTFSNFFKQRTSELAQPEMQLIALSMKLAIENSSPRGLNESAWHLPLIDEDDYEFGIDVRKLSVARCARISFNNFERQSCESDVALHDQLVADGHWSPFEHVAVVGERCVQSDIAWYQGHYYDVGNFAAPFIQYRKFFPGESGE